MNKKFLIFQVTVGVLVGGEPSLYFYYLRSLNPELQAYSNVKHLVPIHITKILEVDATDTKTLELVDLFCTHVHEEVYSYDISDEEGE